MVNIQFLGGYSTMNKRSFVIERKSFSVVFEKDQVDICEKRKLVLISLEVEESLVT